MICSLTPGVVLRLDGVIRRNNPDIVNTEIGLVIKIDTSLYFRYPKETVGGILPVDQRASKNRAGHLHLKLNAELQFAHAGGGLLKVDLDGV